MLNSTTLYERCVVIIVTGNVQGVGFRFFTYQKAQKLGIVGYVKNLINSDVKIVACGSNLQIEQLLLWIKKGGPVSATITDYTIKELETDEMFNSFNVRY